MSKFIFNPNNHSYTLDGKRLTGVTTILGVIAKPALIGWAANMAVDYIEHSYGDKGIDNKETAKLIFKQARTAHRMKKEKAGDIGTDVHKFIEQAIKKCMVLDFVFYENWEEANSDEFHTQGVDDKIQKMFNHFCNWARENKVKFLASEKKVYSEKYFYAGTYDFLCEIDGKTWLGDIKTSSGIYPEMFFQCAGYQICEEEMNPKTKIDGYIIVNLKKDGSFLEKRSISNKNNKQAFLSALTLYRTLEQIKKATL